VNSTDSNQKKWTDLRALIKAKSKELGFQTMGVVAAVEAKGYERFEHWLSLGYGGTMDYLSNRRQAYRHPNSVLDGVQSIVMFAISYKKPVNSNSLPNQFGRVASYAVAPQDYHDTIHERLKTIQAAIHEYFPAVQTRGVVDTAPLLEREYAQLAGLGWVGKNTLLLNRELGSYFFLAALLVDVKIPTDDPFATDHCGSCTACLEACPTKAFPSPYVLDASRCISYLTIEHRSTIPVDLQEQMGDWLFGCDICQQVCPWNRKPVPTEDMEFQTTMEHMGLDLLDLLSMSQEEFRKQFRRTPMWRVKHRGMLRNAMIVAANKKITDAVPLIEQLLSSDDEMISETARTCLQRFSAQA
jgi:epoxyqueuosine reductase